jgi:hypothetical protein
MPNKDGSKSNRTIGDEVDDIVVRKYNQAAKIVGSDLTARTTINSGATFGQLDVQTKLCEISNKHQSTRNFVVKGFELEEAMVKAGKVGKYGVLVGRSHDIMVAVMPLDDFIGILADYENRTNFD